MFDARPSASNMGLFIWKGPEQPLGWSNRSLVPSVSFFKIAEHNLKSPKHGRIFEREKRASSTSAISATVCGFDFERRYGDLGKDCIHVHHLVPLYEIRKAYKSSHSWTAAVDFDSAWNSSEPGMAAEDIPVRYISLEDLIRNKLAVARPQDLVDVENLRAASAAVSKPATPDSQ